MSYRRQTKVEKTMECNCMPDSVVKMCCAQEEASKKK